MKKEVYMTLDSHLEATVQAILENEKKTIKPGTETFKEHENAIRESVRTLTDIYKQKFHEGYEAVATWLEAHRLAKPLISQDALNRVQNQQECFNAIKSGILPFQLFNFSDETLKNCYQAALQLAQDGDFVKSRNAFFFLVTINPRERNFWLGLAITATQLKESDTALNASLTALTLDPTKAEAYLNALHLYLQANDQESAIKLCMQGIDFAKSHSNDVWSRTLGTTLEEALGIVRPKRQA